MAHMELMWCIVPSEVEFAAIRAQGAGGQNVNKMSNPVHLRFNVAASSLPDVVKLRLLAQADQRVTEQGLAVIKARRCRSLEQNKADALARLQALVTAAAYVPRTRKATRPTWTSKQRRLSSKASRAQIKQGRERVSGGD